MNTFRILLSILSILIIMSCSQKPENELVGTWKDIKEDIFLVLYNDNSLIIKGPDKHGNVREMSGHHYRLFKDNSIIFDFDRSQIPHIPLLISINRKKLPIIVFKTKFIITDREYNSTLEFIRVK